MGPSNLHQDKVSWYWRYFNGDLQHLKEFHICLNSTSDSVELFLEYSPREINFLDLKLPKRPQRSCIFTYIQTTILFCMLTVSMPLTLSVTSHLDNFSISGASVVWSRKDMKSFSWKKPQTISLPNSNNYFVLTDRKTVCSDPQYHQTEMEYIIQWSILGEIGPWTSHLCLW